jgi:hypothetical protein
MGDRELVQYAPTATNFLEGPGVYFANTKWANKNQFWFEKIPNSHLEVPNNPTTRPVNKKATLSPL